MNLVKLCVGATSLEDLADWQARRCAERAAAGEDARPRHVTRMWPKRADELIEGGSLYWVIRGMIAARQQIQDLVAATGADGIRRCAIVLCPDLIRVEPRPRAAFQGWRYLAPEDAPRDLSRPAPGDSPLPPDLDAALIEIGVVAI